MTVILKRCTRYHHACDRNTRSDHAPLTTTTMTTTTTIALTTSIVPPALLLHACPPVPVSAQPIEGFAGGYFFSHTVRSFLIEVMYFRCSSSFITSAPRDETRRAMHEERKERRT